MPEAATQTAVAAPASAPAAQPVQPDDDPRWKQVMTLPCSVTVEVPIPGFTAKDLLHLEANSLVRSTWAVTANLPMKVNGEMIAWCEFEILGNRLAIRVTELA